MAVPILQSLVGLIFVLSGIAMAGKPPATKKEQWLYRAIFICLGLLLLALGWIQYRNGQKNEAGLRAVIRTLNTNQTIVQPPPLMESAGVESNQVEIQQKYQNLLSELTTNSSLAPDVREHIIVATAKLGRDAHAGQQMPGEEALSAAQSARTKALPFFDYAIKSLAAMSQEKALLTKDKSVLTYQGLPEDLSPEARAGKRSRKNAAEIEFQATPDWDFQINFTETVLPQYEASLSVTCKGGLLVLKSAGDSIETSVELISGESSAHGAASRDEAKTNIADALEKLVASEANAVEVK